MAHNDAMDSLERYLLFAVSAALLLPWNALITAVDYFAIIFPDQHVDTVLAFAYLCANLLTLFVVLNVDVISAKWRVQLGFVGYAALMSAVPVLDRLQMVDQRGTKTYWWTLVVIVACTGVADALCQGALYGQASALPGYPALISGTAVSGVVISLLRVLTKWSGGEDFASARSAALLYFALAALYEAAALLLYACCFHRLRVRRCGDWSMCPEDATLPSAAASGSLSSATTFSKPGAQEPPDDARTADDAHLRPSNTMSAEASSSAVSMGLTLAVWQIDAPSTLVAGALYSPCTSRSGDVAAPRPHDVEMHLVSETSLSSDGGAPVAATARHLGSAAHDECTASPADDGLWSDAKADVLLLSDCARAAGIDSSTRPSAAEQFLDSGWRWISQIAWIKALIKIRTPAASVFVVYFVTLFIFPGFLSEGVSSPALGSWFTVLLFLTFNVSDWLARSVQAPRAWLLQLCTARLLFVPAFALCAFNILPTPAIFLLTALFGTTNGSLTSTCFVAASQITNGQSDLAGVVMVMSLMTGLWVGSWASWLWLLW